MNKLFFVFIVGYFIYLMLPWLQADLWNDEIYTLEHFTLVHLRTTLTDYHVPNNHIFYNLCNHFYLKLAGIHTLRQAMENVWMLRLPLLLLAILTLLVQYKTARLAGGNIAGVLAMGILAFNVPFQNFCLQVRGYSFSMFFDLLLIYNALAYTLYHRRSNLVWMALCTAATVYTIPSNLYCVMGVLVFFGWGWIWRSMKEKQFDTGNFYGAFAVGAGIVLALLCYLPVIKQAFNNPYVNGSSGPVLSALGGQTESPAVVFYHEVIAGQLFMYLLFAACSLLYFTVPLSPGKNYTGKVWQLITWQLITPVAMIGLRGEHPPDRVFTYAIPLVALWIGVTVAYAIGLVPVAGWRQGILALLLVYLVVAHRQERKDIASLMNGYLRTEQRTQDLRDNYYQYNFHPLRIAQFLEQTAVKTGEPVIIKWSEPHDMPEYLQAFGIDTCNSDSLDYWLKARNKVYWITLFPHELDSSFVAAHHCAAREVLPAGYHHLFELTAL